MHSDSLDELGDCALQLSKAIEAFSERSRVDTTSSDDSLPAVVARQQQQQHYHHQQRSLDAKGSIRDVLNLSNRIQTLLVEPNSFIQQISTQCQLLACLQWLADFQILACIPLTGSVPTRDIAELVGVREVQLGRIVRLLATAGFLSETQPGLLAHTALSAAFVTNVDYLDAVTFLAKTAVPAASQMSAAAMLELQQDRPNDMKTSAYSLAFNKTSGFESACEQRSKLLGEYKAYLRCMGDADEKIDDENAMDLLLQLDWSALGSARVVIANANSTRVADAISASYPALQFVIQMTESQQIPVSDVSSNITITTRVTGTLQTIDDAAVYILSSSHWSLALLRHNGQQTIDRQLQAELHAHIGVLRNNPSATLILTPRLLPEPGALDSDVEAFARVRDLSRLQLMNEQDRDLGEFMTALNTIQDHTGRLVVVNQLKLRRTTMMALGIKYQSHADGRRASSLAINL